MLPTKNVDWKARKEKLCRKLFDFYEKTEAEFSLMKGTKRR